MKDLAIGLLGGRELALLRHLQRRGPQSLDQLVDRFVDGSPRWRAEDLDLALSALIEEGYLHTPGADGLHRLVLRSPL